MKKFNIFFDKKTKVFSPASDMTPIEAARLSQLFMVMLTYQTADIVAEGLQDSEIYKFLELHNLSRHFKSAA